jgi:hypothetical protein
LQQLRQEFCKRLSCNPVKREDWNDGRVGVCVPLAALAPLALNGSEDFDALAFALGFFGSFVVAVGGREMLGLGSEKGDYVRNVRFAARRAREFVAAGTGFGGALDGGGVHRRVQRGQGKEDDPAVRRPHGDCEEPAVRGRGDRRNPVGAEGGGRAPIGDIGFLHGRRLDGEVRFLEAVVRSGVSAADARRIDVGAQGGIGSAACGAVGAWPVEGGRFEGSDRRAGAGSELGVKKTNGER